MKNKGVKGFMDSKAFLMLVSMFFATVLWSVVVNYVSNDVRTQIKGVAVNMNYNKSAYESLGLEVIETDIETVDVWVSGPRSVVGTLSPDDIIIYPQLANVRDSGKYTLALTAIKTTSVKDFQIESLSASRIAVKFDRITEKVFTVDIDVSNLIIPGEYMVDKIYTNPETLSLSGPENTIASIAKVVAKTQDATLTQSAVLPASLKYYDANGAEIDPAHIETTTEEVTVTVPVLKEVKVPVKVEFINVPVGFDTSTLNLSLSHTTVHLAVPSSVADSYKEFVVGYIDLKTLETDNPYMFDVRLPSGYKNMNDVEKISATVSGANIYTRDVAVSEIKLINKGERNVEVLTQIINNVTIVGEPEILEGLSSGSIIAQIDLTRVTLAQGQQTVEVEIIIPSTSHAYAKGTYYATIKN